MIHRFGDRSRFAIEVGEVHPELDGSRQVDVWAGGRWLTCDDNSVYVTHFIGEVERDLRRLLRDPGDPRNARPDPKRSPADIHRRFCDEALEDNAEYLAYLFMDWGPTADNVHMHLFREAGIAYLPFSFWRERHHDPSELGQVFVAELPDWELAGVLHDANWSLTRDWFARSR